ncbi:MAG: hypothetical protein JSU73_04120 [candidate division WOR-3 bacterium]|nr:MAG: hypothetical protein JSU73_04120 [candidate division WOR-3 bacterium]
MTTLEPGGVRRRVLRTVNRDGLFDLGLGLGLLLVAGWFALERFAEVQMTGIFAILPMMILFLVRGMRKRYTYPRVGYANLKTGPVRLGLMIGLLVTVLLVLATFLAFQFTSLRVPRSIFGYLPTFLGLVGVGGLAYFSYRTGYPRYLVYAGLDLTLLAIVLLLRAEAIFTFIAPAAVVGTVMFVTGIATFVRFLRTHPRIEEEAPNGT